MSDPYASSRAAVEAARQATEALRRADIAAEQSRMLHRSGDDADEVLRIAAIIVAVLVVVAFLALL